VSLGYELENREIVVLFLEQTKVLFFSKASRLLWDLETGAGR
jgi:hypothetical protein